MLIDIDNNPFAESQLAEKTAKKRQSGIKNFFKKVESNPKRSLSPLLPPVADGKKLRTKLDLQPPSKMPCFK